MIKKDKTILITGAYGGLATKTIELLIEKKWKVFAGDINPKIIEKYADSKSVVPFIIDITDETSMKDAYSFVSQKTDGLDAILSMAGILKIGSVVEISIEDAKRIMDINLFGIYAVNKIFLPLIINRKGRILTMSSEVGEQMAAPFNGLYSMSKHALEAYSDALRRELAFIEIKVIKIQPGPFKTAMTKNAERLFIEAEEQSLLFKKNLKRGIPYLPKVYKAAHDPIYVAKSILKALESSNPKIAYSIRMDKARKFLDWLPVSWADKIILKTLS